MTFQPGEIAKITLAIFFAGYLSSNRDLILLAGRKVGPLQFPRFKDMGPMIAAWLVSIGVLIFQRDLGILDPVLRPVPRHDLRGHQPDQLGHHRRRPHGLPAASSPPSVFSHVALRIDGWLNAFTEEVYGREFGGSLQIVEGLFGMANGGLVGTGLGQGRPNLVPFANSDMIIASFGEELGLIGLFAIVLMYLLLFTRGFRAALGTRDAFGKLLASRAILRDRPAVLRRDRRRHAADPADRTHHAVPRRRRLLAAGELDHRGPAAHDFAHRTRPGGHHAAAARPGTRCSEGSSGQALAGAVLRPPYQSRSTHRGGETPVNQAIRNSWIAAIAMFVLIFGALSYVQVVGADELKANAWNKRTLLQNYCNDRGAIIVGGHPGGRVRTGHRRAASSSAPTPSRSCTPASPGTSRSNYGADRPGKDDERRAGRQLRPAVPGPRRPAVPGQPAQGRLRGADAGSRTSRNSPTTSFPTASAARSW